MTGTSCDGLDATCVEFKRGSFHVHWTQTARYPEDLRKQVLNLQLPKQKTSVRHLLRLDREISLWYGKQIHQMIKKSHKKPHLIACHGQTIAHFPSDQTTLQLGNPAVLSEKTGLTIISNFREGDMAAGGEGAPLATNFHSYLLSKHKGRALIQNIGGIANLSYLTPNARMISFDTGTGNLWIDEAIQRYSHKKKKFDHSGNTAKRGTVDFLAVKKMIKKSFFRLPPPKSTGRDDFPFENLLQITSVRGPNLVATATEITVESIANAYERFILGKFPLQTAYICGGGAYNKFLIERLQKRIPKVRFQSSENLGIPPLTMESIAFAWLGYRALLGCPAGGQWTGSHLHAPAPRITPGRNWKDIYG